MIVYNLVLEYNSIMKICERHTRLIPEERFNDVFQEFSSKMRVSDYQDNIESRKNQCMVCHFGREGTAMLQEIAGGGKK